MNLSISKLSCCALFFFIFNTVFAQTKTQRLTYNPQFLLAQEAQLYSMDSNQVFHTSIRPYRPIDLVEFIDPKHLSDSYKAMPLRSKFQRRFFHEDVIQYVNVAQGFDIRINPLFNFELIADKSMGEFYSADAANEKKAGIVNTRGVQVLGQLGKRFSFYTEVTENQIEVPGYVKDWSFQHDYVLPGQGSPESFNSDKDVYDLFQASGYFQYKSKNYFTFEFGQGNHFIGDGYRSLILSDNAINYPYLKIQTQFGKVKYMNLYTKFLDVNPSEDDANHYSKWSAMHYLTFNLGKRWSFGLFEATIWGDRENQRGYDVGYLNPLIFYRSLEFSNGSEGTNVLIGGTVQFRTGSKSALYGQFILDEFTLSELTKANGYWGNKFGFQGGFKVYDFLAIPKFNLRTEVNLVRPFTYSHEVSNDPDLGGLSNYGHLNQGLAHPLGSNFIEWMSTASYQYKRWLINGQLMMATKGYNPDGQNIGGDIYDSYVSRSSHYGIEFLGGNKTSITAISGKLAYLINPSYQFKIEAGLMLRNISPEVETDALKTRNDAIFTFGIKTDLFKKSYDF
ncbi:MAG: hypothetical protein ACPGVE_02050 [Flavobacteriales bacterium]